MPTATIRPSRTATAVAGEPLSDSARVMARPSSGTVYIGPPVKSRSAWSVIVTASVISSCR